MKSKYVYEDIEKLDSKQACIDMYEKLSVEQSAISEEFDLIKEKLDELYMKTTKDRKSISHFEKKISDLDLAFENNDFLRQHLKIFARDNYNHHFNFHMDLDALEDDDEDIWSDELD